MRLLLPSLLILLAACAPLAPSVPGPAPGSSATEQRGDVIEPTAPSPTLGTGAIVSERLLPSGALEIGDPAAPVSLLLFTNFRSAYARQYHERLFLQLVSEYVQPGKARVTILPLQLLKYGDSDRSTAALLCAARQGKGLTMNDLLYRASPDSSAFSARLTEAGIDSAALSACMEGNDIGWILSAQASFARSLHVSLVPSTFINGSLLVGLPEWPDLRGRMERALR